MKDMTLSLSAQTDPGPVAGLSPPLRRSAGRVEFALGCERDDADIRAFLAGQTVAGAVQLEVRTEPSFRAALALLGEDAAILLARERATRRLVGLGVRTSRQLSVNLQPRTVGHLSFLRVAADYRGRRDFLRAGYALLRELQERRPVDFCLTAILAENHAARRLLEAGLPGLPVYRPLTDVLTFTIATPLVSAPWSNPAVDPCSLAAFLSHHISPMPLAPVINASTFASPSPGHLTCDDFVTLREGNQLLAAAAIWDQRPIRQFCITGYGGVLRQFRIFYNVLQFFRRRPGLPAPGILNHAFISHLAVDPQARTHFPLLLKSLTLAGRARGIDFLTLSLAAGHPLCSVAAQIAIHHTRSSLYAVHWPDQPAPEIPSAIPYVEAAHL